MEKSVFLVLFTFKSEKYEQTPRNGYTYVWNNSFEDDGKSVWNVIFLVSVESLNPFHRIHSFLYFNFTIQHLGVESVWAFIWTVVLKLLNVSMLVPRREWLY